MEYAEDDYLMISGIQHFKFCRRQWALIHIEQQWEENVHTAVGELMHKKVHDPYLAEKRKGVLITRALPVSSKSMGVSGECDVVEFHRCEDGIKLHGHRDLYSIYPIEYKKGKPKVTEEDKLQLVAQAMCLEEMFSTEILEGAIFYGETRRENICIYLLSLPSWERGLKLLPQNWTAGSGNVAPLVGAWIEIHGFVMRIHPGACRSPRGSVD